MVPLETSSKGTAIRFGTKPLWNKPTWRYFVAVTTLPSRKCVRVTRVGLYFCVCVVCSVCGCVWVCIGECVGIGEYCVGECEKGFKMY